MKKLLPVFSVTLLLLFSLVPFTVLANNPITIQLDGQTLTLPDNIQPVMEDNRVLIPYRAIAESMGAEVQWLPSEAKVVAVKGSKTVSFIIGQNKMNVNGKEQSLDTGARVIKDRTMVPVRFIAEAFGADVSWENNTVQVITKPDPGTAILLKSTEEVAKLNSYRFDGDISMTSSLPGSKDAFAMDMKMEGAFVKPASMLVSTSMKMPQIPGLPKDEKIPETIVMDMFFDNGVYYIKGNLPDQPQGKPGQWIKMDMNLPASAQEMMLQSQDPAKAVEMITKLGLKPSSFEEKDIDGKKYYKLTVGINQEAMTEMLKEMMPAQKDDNDAKAELDALFKTMNMKFNYVYYINAETYISDIVEFTGTQTMAVTPEESLTINFKGSMTMKDLNKTVSFPDVSQAVSMTE